MGRVIQTTALNHIRQNHNKRQRAASNTTKHQTLTKTFVTTHLPPARSLRSQTHLRLPTAPQYTIHIEYTCIFQYMASSSDPARLLAVDQHQYHQLLHNQLHQNHHQYPHYPRLKSSASSASLRSREGGTPPPATAAAAPATPTTAAAMDNSANASGSGNVKVVVRVRAFLPRGRSGRGGRGEVGWGGN